jgi:hypothetical protein
MKKIRVEIDQFQYSINSGLTYKDWFLKQMEDAGIPIKNGEVERGVWEALSPPEEPNMRYITWKEE